jgi:outer membrane protein TolC
MPFAKSFLAVLLCCAIALPGFGQTPELSGGHRNFFSWLTNNYVGHPEPAVSYEDSPRLEKLMRAGAIYLSLRDAIALALENNLDLEYARYNPKLAQANLKRVSAGSLLRNVSSNISSGPSSATLGVLGGTALGSGGTSSSSTGSGQGGVLSGLNVQLQGTAVPNLDPVIYLSGQFSHSTLIETATNITGTNFLVTQYKSTVWGAQEGFLTGTTLQAYMSNQYGLSQNSPYNMFNPYTQASLNLSLTQNLLQGFRPSVNNRYIRVAKNSLRISDLTFENQVIATVVGTVSLYWDLVSDIESFKVKQQTLDLNTRQYNDNKRKAELGAIALIDIIQAEAEMKASQQDVTTARAQVLNQEMIIKNYLTRGGMDNLAIVQAHIVPTDRFDVPEQESVRPIQDLIAEAMASRPDVEQSQISLENARITTLGVKDALLPVLAATATTSNNGLAGVVNTVPGPGGVPQFTAGNVNQYFLGGFGTAVGQIFGRNFPNYSVGVSLTMTLKNRSAQADLITDQLNYRQQQIQDRQLHNNIKQNVINARISLEQARSAYETAVEARKLQEQVLQGSRRKYELGTATILDVIIAQRDTTTRELSEVDARSQYIHARLNLDNVLGTVLKTYDVNIDQAKIGMVGREPDLIPVVAPSGPAPAAAAARPLH